MASLRDLVQMSMEELWQAHDRKQIPSQISNCPSQTAAKALSHEGFYQDYGNYAGSVVMFMLLFPGDFLDPNDASLSVLPLFNGAGDREEVLREEGKRVPQCLLPVCQENGRNPRNRTRSHRLSRLLQHQNPDRMRQECIETALGSHPGAPG